MALEGVVGARISIRTFDLDQTLCFYRDILGLSERERFQSGAVLGTDHLEIVVIHQLDAPRRADGMISLGVRVKDLQLVHRQLVAKNCDADGIVEKPWGQRQFVVRDPNGIAIYVMESGDRSVFEKESVKNRCQDRRGM